MNNLVKELAKKLEAVCVENNFHIALTGGQLYKDGERKDIDFVVYNSTGHDKPESLQALMLKFHHSIPEFCYTDYYGYVCKGVYKDVNIDFLYPEYHGENKYPEDD